MLITILMPLKYCFFECHHSKRYGYQVLNNIAKLYMPKCMSLISRVYNKRGQYRTGKMCSEGNVILHVWRDPHDVILRVLHAASEELGASTSTYHQESFRAIPILFPPRALPRKLELSGATYGFVVNYFCGTLT